MARGVFVLFLVLGECCRVAALNPSKALTQYSISHWTQEQGLPQNTISAIAQTADGYLWLGTDEGLARFDGYEFVVFNRDAGKLPSNSILALVAGPDGALWIGTPNGLTEYHNRTFRTYTQKEGLPGNSVSSLFVIMPEFYGSWPEEISAASMGADSPITCGSVTSRSMWSAP
jgi:ligand-binding sensor domain-containing protein